MKSVFTRFYWFGIFLLLMCNSLTGQNLSKQEILEQLYSGEGERYFSFSRNNHRQYADLGRIISLDRVDRDGTVFAYANRKEFSRFLDFNIRYEILPHPGDYHGFINMKHQVDISNIQAWDFYPSYEAYVDMMNQFASQYPGICQVFSIGQTTQGREILVARISDNVGIREKEPQFLYTSTIHGDETTGFILMLRLIDYLLTNYGSNPRITSMVDGIDIWINPNANPDGTYAGGNDTVSGARRYNANWIDINRNFPDPEDGPHPDGEDWQAETLVFMDFAEDNDFVSSANLHGGEEVCNYPWDTWSRLAADDDWWQYVCHEYADTAQLHSPPGYMSDFDDGITNGYDWYSISGGRQDYMNFFHQAREFTLEISDTKLLPSGQLPAWWEYNYRSLLNYMEQSMYGVRGVVKDSVSGWPVRAEVYAVLHELDSSWVYSSLPNGNYHRLLHEGTYNLKFSAAGYETKMINNVSVMNRQATVLDVQLVPAGVGGIDHHPVTSKIRIYPNPVHTDYLTFDAEIIVDRVEILDMTGKMVASYAPERKNLNVDVSMLSKGFYTVKFYTGEGTGIRKMIRQ